MAEEEALMRVHVLEEQKKEVIEEEAEKSRITWERAKDELWKQTMLEQAVEKEQLIQRLMEAAKLRGTRKRRRRGGKGKGKGKKGKK